MAGLGETLRKAREQAALSLDEVESLTRVRRKYLQALEDEDFASLPSIVYVKGFVKNCAAALHLNAQDLLDMLPMEEPKLEMKPVATLEKPRRGYGVLLFGLLLVCMVGGLSAYLYNYYQNNQTTPTPDDLAIVIPTSTILPTPTPPSVATPSPTTAVISGSVEIRVRAIDRAWMAVYIDGDSRAVYNATMEIGETQTFAGKQRVYIHCGNAGGVDYTVNNQRKGLMGKPGEVVRLEWSLPPTGGPPVVRSVDASERPFNPNPTSPPSRTGDTTPTSAATARPSSPTAAGGTPRPASPTSTPAR